MTAANGPDVISTLLNFPPSYAVDTFSLPLATIFSESRLTREQLLPAIGSGMRVGGWTVSYDAEYDRVHYVRIKPLPRPATPIPRSGLAVPVAPRPIDPVAVGLAAREFQDAELKAGREVTATEAVAHVMGKRG